MSRIRRNRRSALNLIFEHSRTLQNGVLQRWAFGCGHELIELLRQFVQPLDSDIPRACH
jgi:hypothetical protein